MAATEIRSARPDDAAAVAALCEEAGRHFVAADPDAFRVPNAAGLEGWLRSAIPAADDPSEAFWVATVAGIAEAWGWSRGAEVAVLDANWTSGVATGFYEERLRYRWQSLGFRKGSPHA